MTGHCINSGKFLRVHLSCRKSNQFTFHHQFGIDTWRSQFEQQPDSILSACGSHGQKHKDPDTIDLEAPRFAQYMHKAWKKHQNTVYWVDIQLAQQKNLSSIKQDRTQSSFTTHSQLIVSRKLFGWSLEKLCTRKFMRHLDLLERFP